MRFAEPSAVSTAAKCINNTLLRLMERQSFHLRRTGNTLSGSFFGTALATNIFNGNISLSGTLAFSNFLGTVIITNFSGNGVRMFNGTGNGGGDNTTFDFETGFLFSRDPSTIHLGVEGAQRGNQHPSVSAAVNTTTNAGVITTNVTAAPATFLIGAKGPTEFAGTIAGTNNITKTGAGSLTLDAILVDSVLTDNATYTNNQYDPACKITYVVNTHHQQRLANPGCAEQLHAVADHHTFAGVGAVLDATSMGSHQQPVGWPRKSD